LLSTLSSIPYILRRPVSIWQTTNLQRQSYRSKISRAKLPLSRKTPIPLMSPWFLTSRKYTSQYRLIFLKGPKSQHFIVTSHILFALYSSTRSIKSHSQTCLRILINCKRCIKRHRPRNSPLTRNTRLFRSRNLLFSPVRAQLRHTFHHSPRAIRLHRQQRSNHARCSRRHNIPCLYKDSPHSLDGPLLW
jgi:hypothetical protein